MLNEADRQALAAFKKSLEPHLNDPGTNGCQARMLTATCKAIAEAVRAEQVAGRNPGDIIDGIIAVCGNILGPAAQNFKAEGHSDIEMLSYLLDCIHNDTSIKILNQKEFKSIAVVGPDTTQ